MHNYYLYIRFKQQEDELGLTSVLLYILQSSWQVSKVDSQLSWIWPFPVSWKEHKNSRQQQYRISEAQHLQGHKEHCSIAPNQPDQKSSELLLAAHWVCSCRQPQTFQGTETDWVSEGLGYLDKKESQEHKKNPRGSCFKWSPTGTGIAILEQKAESSI